MKIYRRSKRKRILSKELMNYKFVESKKILNSIKSWTNDQLCDYLESYGVKTDQIKIEGLDGKDFVNLMVCKEWVIEIFMVKK